MGDDNRYEAAALKGKLNQEESLEVVETFAKLRDVSKTAIRLNLPIKLVRKTLNNRKYEGFAKTLIRHSVGSEFYGEGLEVALGIMRDPESRPADKLSALKFVDAVLSASTPKVEPIEPAESEDEDDEVLDFNQLVQRLAEEAADGDEEES